MFPDPKDGPGQAIRVLFAVVTSIVRIPNPSADQLAIGDKAAHQLLDYNRKPAGVSDTDWANARTQLPPPAKAALLYIAMLPGNQAMAKTPKDCPAACLLYTSRCV